MADLSRLGPSSEKETLRRRIGRNVLFLGIVSGLTDVSSEMLYPVVPLFLTVELGAPMSAVGLIEGVAEAAASLLKAAGGRLSDRTGRRKPFIVFGYALSAASRPALALAAAWPWVLAVRLVDRVGKGARTAPRDALIAASARPEDHGLAFGFHRAMDTAGAVLGPILSLLLMNYAGFTYRRLFLAAFAPAALGVAVLSAFVREETPAEEAPARSEPPGSAARPFSAAADGLSPEFKRLLFAYGVFAAGNSSDAFLLLRAKQAAFSTTDVLLAYVAYNAVYASTATAAGRISDRFGRARTLAAGLGIFAAVYLGFALAASKPAFWGLFLAYGLYAAATEGVAKALVAGLCAPENRGWAMGFFQGLTGVLAFVASVAAGLLWAHVSPRAPFLVGAAGAAVSAMLLLAGFGG